MGVCNCSMFCCTLLYVHSSIEIILKGKRELVALFYLSSWCLLMVEWLLGLSEVVIVVIPDPTHFLFILFVKDIIRGWVNVGNILFTKVIIRIWVKVRNILFTKL